MIDIVVKSNESPFPNTEWVTYRGLRRIPGEPVRKSNEQYQDILPKYEGLDLPQILEVMASSENGGRWLDLGCGSGVALLDARKEFPAGKLEIVGIGHAEDTQLHIRDVDRGRVRTNSRPFGRSKNQFCVDRFYSIGSSRNGSI